MRTNIKFLAVAAVTVFVSAAFSQTFAASEAPPASDFFTKSWDSVYNSFKYKATCSYSAGKLKYDTSATADQKAGFAVIEAALKRIKIKTIDAIDGGQMMVYSENATLNPVKLLDKYKPGEISNEEMLKKIKEHALATGKFIVSQQGIYFSAGKKGSWKTFGNEELINNLLASMIGPITSGYEQESFTFSKWTNDKTGKKAIYEGKITAEGTTGLIGRVSPSFVAEGQPAGNLKITVNEKDGLWQKVEANIDVAVGQVSFPLKQTCSLACGNKVKIANPASAEKLDEETGATQFVELVNSL